MFASDFMEPFRILVDRRVNAMRPTCFEHDEKMQVMQFLNDEIMIDGKYNFVSNAIKIYCRSLFDALNEEDISLIKFYRNEL